ncbi:BRO family protein [Faecalibacillus intestinalis]|uniref:BRO family protein n=1 Tax=Faecalibacillus intestinalis TaxID=1982626 RepID=UPI002E77EEBD|nr:BRO family protein [Faecalibacillus intestinalis]MEE1447556.1 BRO family protein [Faecalibacillus intestinalis]
MEELQIFQNKEFGEVRSLVINNEPWFVGKDVAEALGYKDVNHAILDHVDEEDKVNSKTQGQNAPELGQRGSWLINESGLYSLILSSKLPNAKKFKRWVTSEVLPTLRKTGSYAKVPTDPRELLMLTIKAHEQTAQRVDVLEEKVSDLEKSTTIDSSQQYTLERIAKTTVISALGGIDSRAYQLMSRKLFSNIWRDYKKYFKLGSYRDTLKTDYENAKNYLESWSPEVNTSLKIKEYNSQLAMNLDYNN